VLSKHLELDRDTGTVKGAIAEREVSQENRGRSQSEIEAMDESVRSGFGGSATRQAHEQERRQATGDGN
jgi:hypothetical protein